MARKATQMSQDLSEVSLAIGELRAGQAADRQALQEIKSDVKTIMGAMSNLPPSPTCVVKYTQLDERIDNIHKEVKWLSAKVGALIAAGATVAKVGLNKLGIDI